MARPKKLDVRAEAAKLLALTLQGAQAKYKECADLGITVDAATISASVALLKMTEAWDNETKGGKAGELDKLQKDFKARSAARDSALATTPSRSTLLAEYGLNDGGTA